MSKVPYNIMTASITKWRLNHGGEDIHRHLSPEEHENQQHQWSLALHPTSMLLWSLSMVF